MISHPDNAGTARLRVTLFTIFLNVLAVILFARVSFSDWRTGMGLNVLDNGIFIAYLLKYRDRVMGWLLIFGVILGFSELLADAWLVDVTRTLDYSPGGGPFIWRSPLWMPFAWEVVAVQFAVLGGWLKERLGLGGILLAGVIGAINIPFYEEMAMKTHWWAYRGCRMLAHTPYYIILGEFLIVIALVLLSQKAKEQKAMAAVINGLIGGLVIFLCYTLAFLIFEAR